MPAPLSMLRFVWWNVQDFAHYDTRQIAYERWPDTEEAYIEKRRRVETVLQRLSAQGQPELLAFGEITEQALLDVRGSLFPEYSAWSLATLYVEPVFHVGLLYRPSAGFKGEDFLAVSNVPAATRPMAILDFRAGGHVIRFFVCHWTARLSHESQEWRDTTARELRSAIYTFLHPKEWTDETRHVVVLGDFNEEPYGNLERSLFAGRDRQATRRGPHYTDRSIQRTRLYNCAWRLLGEHYPHPLRAGERDMAGSFYWQEKRTWHTFDHVIVSGSLLGQNPPYLDEATVRIASSTDVLPEEFLGKGGLPEKYALEAGTVKGVSDHLPLCGTIVLEKDPENV